MSTKMSTDLNITRATSRVSAPPGGRSTFSFGAEEPAPAKVVNSPAKGKAEPVVAAPAPAAPVVEKKDIAGKVGVVIADKIAPEALSQAIVKALFLHGIKGTVVTVVNDFSVLPYATQNLAKSVDVVVAATLLVNDPTGAVHQSLYSALLQIGVTGTTPVVPAIVKQDSLLEAKALLPTLAEGWAESVAAILSSKGGAELEVKEADAPVIVEKPVLTPAVHSADVLLEILRESLKSHGARGIAGIARKFRIADDNGNGAIDLAEFTKVINEHALGWTKEQVKDVFDHFDKDKSKSIEYDEFLVGLRGQLNERRKQLVLLAFEVLDSDKSGVIELNDITAKYNATKHPDVIAGKRTTESVLREFLDTFDSEEKDGKVTPDEFIKYYGNVSASIDDDDYFELMIRNAWHISGGEGWCANSSCRRVLVVHTDGRQTVEEIKNDIGMKGDDKEAMLANLVAQGITDVASIDTSGSTSGPSAPPAAAAEPAKAANAAAGSKNLVGEQSIRPATAPSTNNPRRQPGGASSIVIG